MTGNAPAPDSLPRPPHPAATTSAGPRFTPDPLEVLPQLARAYGDIVDLGESQPAYLLSNPRDIEFVHVQTGRLFDKGYLNSPAMERLFGRGLVVSEGDFWLRQRRMAQPAFHRDRIAGYGAVMVDLARRMLAGWQDGEERDAHADMMRVTLDIIVKTLFDADMDRGATVRGEPLDTRARAFGQSMDDMLGAMAELYVAAPQDQEAVAGRFYGAVDRIDAFVEGVIQERRAGGEDRGDLLSMLLAAQDDEARGMTDQQLLDEAKNLIMAGHETTSNTLSWTWWLLSRHPEVEARLHAELDEVLGGEAPRVEDLGRLPYARNVILESMRVLPPVWSVGRVARQDLELGGFFVPAGTVLSMSQWVVHRDERWFAAPLAFRPERWEDGLEKKLPRYAYFPFGGGPRVCIGENFARMEAVLLLATIAQQYSLRVPANFEVELEPSITLRPRHGLKVRLERRAEAR